MFTDAVEGVLDRLLELEKLAIPTTKNAVPYFLYWQSTFPYWTNRLTRISPTTKQSMNARKEIVITARFVVGHVTENLPGANELSAILQGASIVEFFETYPRLDAPGVASPGIPRYLAPEGCRVDLPRGENFFIMSQTIVQVGIEIDLTIPFSYSIE